MRWPQPDAKRVLEYAAMYAFFAAIIWAVYEIYPQGAVIVAGFLFGRAPE